jgi:hypothetical protein
MTRTLDPEPQHQIFTLRRSILIWFCGGVIGWAAMIMLGYSVFHPSDRQIADTTPVGNTPAIASSDQNSADPEALSKIAPAAGPDTDATDTAPSQ